MIDKRQLAALFFGTALLAACDKAAKGREDGYAPTAVADASAKFRTMPEKQVLDLAFKAAFKGDPQAVLDDTRYAFKPEAVRWVGGRAVLISGGQGDDCHGCAGTLAVHYLQPRGDGFEVVGAWPQAASGGTFGAPPAWTLRTDLADNPVLETGSGGTFQGYTCRTAQLVELAPDAPVLIADGVQLGYDDAGAAVDRAAEGIEGKIFPGAKGRSFVVVYKGTRTARVTYEKHGAVYQKAKGSPDLPSC